MANSRPSWFSAAPLERQLPLIMGGVILVMLAALLGITRATLYRSAEEAARAKLAHTGQQLQAFLDLSVDASAARLKKAAANPLYKAALARAGSRRQGAALRRALATTFLPADTGLSVELMDAQRRLVASASDGRPAAPLMPDQRSKVMPGASSEVVEPRADGVMFGSIYRVGDAAYSWQVAPVLDAGRTIGYLALQRRSTTAQTQAQPIRNLLGGDANWYARTRDGSIWIEVPGPIASPPERRTVVDGNATDYRPGVGALATVEVPLHYSPVVMVIETPLKTVLASARTTWIRVASLGAVLALIGILLSWFLGRRIAQLETRVIEERAANRAKGDFLAVMSHELRTPLNAIAGYNELIAMGMYGPVTPGQRDALARVARSQNHLLALITDVLNFAKIEAGELRYDVREVRLDETLSAAELLVTPQLGAKALTFSHRHSAPEVLVRADKERLKQVVVNLLGNAIKFTPKGGSIELESEVAGDQVTIRVRDTGIGIAPNRLDSIFEPFVQGERAHNRPNEGVGLGLAIARDLVRAMGGDITVSSTVGQGSVFTVTLVRARASDLAAATLPTPAVTVRV